MAAFRTPPSGPTLSERLWEEAYLKVKQSSLKLVKDFEEKCLPPGQSGGAQKVAEALAGKLRHRDAEQIVIKIRQQEINLREQGENIVKFVMWSSDYVGSLARLEPHAAIAWAGVSLLLPLLLNSKEQKDDMMRGLDRVTKLLPLYKIREDLYLDQAQSGTEFELSVVRLYTSILEYQIRMYLYLSHGSLVRHARDMIRKDSWNEWLTTVNGHDDQCLQFTGLIDTEREAKQWQKHFGLLIDQADKQSRMLKALESLQQQHTQDQVESINMKCMQALSSDYEGQKNFNSKRVPKTCEWVLKDSRFLGWRDSNTSSICCIWAGPGCGKSVLSRCLVDERHLSTTMLTSSTCYFFFKDGAEDRCHAYNAVAALIHQFLSTHDDIDLLNSVTRSYRNHGDNLRNMFNELWRLLQEIVRYHNTGELICLVDALDECEQVSRKVFLQGLVDFYSSLSGQSPRGRLKFFITSRPSSDIVQELSRLRGQPGFTEISDEEQSDIISQEVALVIRERVPHALPLLTPADHSVIIQDMCQHEQRTFLWMHLVLEYLQATSAENNTVRKIRKAISKQFPSLNSAYQAILDKNAQLKKARLLLQVVAAARRPLTMEELSIAVDIANASEGECSSYDDLDTPSTASIEASIRSICGSLIVSYGGKAVFLHQTVKDFVYDQTTDTQDGRWQHCSEPDTEALMARLCMSILLLNDFKRKRIELDFDGDDDEFDSYNEDLNALLLQTIKSCPMLEYSSLHWHDHMSRVGRELSDKEYSSVNTLLDPELPTCQLWFAIWSAQWNLPNNRIHARTAQNCCEWRKLSLAVSTGIKDLVEQILQEGGIDVNERSFTLVRRRRPYHCQTALQAAAAMGSVEVVNILLDNQADVHMLENDFLGGSYGSPLHAASMNGYSSIVQTLLQHGADPIAESGYYVTAQAAAAAGSHTKVLNLLLQRHVQIAPSGARIIANVNTTQRKEGESTHPSTDPELPAHVRSLRLMSARGNTHSINILLQTYQRLSGNVVGDATSIPETLMKEDRVFIMYLFYSVLMNAARSGDVEIVKVFTSVRACDDADYWKVLEAAAKAGHTAIVAILLDFSKDIYGKHRALKAAIMTDNYAMVELLLQGGADANRHEIFKPTPSAKHAISKLMAIEAPWKVQRAFDSVLPSLQLAAQRGNPRVVKALIDHGARINGRNFIDGSTALDTALTLGNQAVVQILENRGARISTDLDQDATTRE